MELPFDVGKTIDSLSKVTLRGGAIGKVVVMVAITVLSLAAISLTIGNDWIAGSIAIMVFLLVLVIAWRLINFADRHPQAAILEGAEFLAHEQIANASKYMPAIKVNPNDKEQFEPVVNIVADVEVAQIPDQSSIEALPTNSEDR